MKLKPLALGISMGIMAAIALVLITYYPVVTHKLSFMNQHGNVLRSILTDAYPLYYHTPWYRALIFGPIIAFADGFIGGYLFAVIYNWALKFGKK